MKKKIFAALIAATALLPMAAQAQDGNRGRGDRGGWQRGGGSEARPQRPAPPQAQPQARPTFGGREGSGFRGAPQGRPAHVQQQSSAPQAPVPQAAPQAPQPSRGGQWSGRPSGGERPQWNGNRPGGDRPQWNGGRPDGDRPRWSGQRPGGDRPLSNGGRPGGDRPQWNGDRPGGDRPQWNGNRPSGDRPGWNDNRPGGDRPQWNGNRPGGDRSQWSGNRQPNRGGFSSGPGRRFGDWRDNDRYRADLNDRRAWQRNWRNDNRYDWQRYRYSNRNIFRMPRYYAPSGWGYGYRRFSIGFSLSSMLFGPDYWIGDPGYYRLPPAYGPYRWVRYYDDALLVDIRTGMVVDVIYDIFW